MSVTAGRRMVGSARDRGLPGLPAVRDESLALGACYLAMADRHGHDAVLALVHCYLSDDLTDEGARSRV